jgi:hypothetical protein
MCLTASVSNRSKRLGLPPLRDTKPKYDVLTILIAVC